MSWPKTPEQHGHAKRGEKLSPTYRTWQAMLTRCTNPRAKSFADYGARGVTVCDRWKTFANFLADMGSDHLARLWTARRTRSAMSQAIAAGPQSSPRRGTHEPT